MGWARLLYRVLDRATMPPVLVVFAAAQAVALGIVGVRYLLSLRGILGPAGTPVTGDFLAFFTGARLIRQGEGRSLYDLDRQYRLQSGMIGGQLSHWQPYFNPPLLALVVATWVGLPYVGAFYLFCLLMLATLAATLFMLRPLLSHLGGRWQSWLIMVLIVSMFHPLYRTTIGGQNTSLTLCLLTGLVAMHVSGRPSRAGIFLGLLSYKPQFCLLPLLVLTVRRQVRALMTAAVVVLGHYLLAAAFCGPRWPLQMMRALAQTREHEWAAGVETHFSLYPFLLNVLSAPWSKMLSALAVLAIVVLVIVWTRRLEANQTADRLLWGLVVAAAMLISPHLRYYEAGLLVLPALLGLDHVLSRGSRPPLVTRTLLALGYEAYPVYGLARVLGFQPLVLWPVVLFIWLTVMARQQRSLQR